MSKKYTPNDDFHRLHDASIKYFNLTAMVNKVVDDEEEAYILITKYLTEFPTIRFLAAIEEKNNIHYRSQYLNEIREVVSNNAFLLTPEKWIKNTKTNNMKIILGTGKQEEVWATRIIAIHFICWLDPQAYLQVMENYFDFKTERFEGFKDWSLN